MIDLTPNTGIPDWLPLIGLYAEIHYRFRFFKFSLYYRKQPEIVFDAPHRLEPGQSLPVTLIIKDAHRFPVTLERITLKVSAGDQTLSEVIDLNTDITDRFWFRIFELDVSKFPPGELKLETRAHIKTRKHNFIVDQDNYPPLSHAPFRVYKAREPLPNLPGWHTGELHCHTSYGPDQVEFGAPLPSIKRTAESLGLDWVALTDHSYDLDDYEDDYLHDDPELKKWKRFQAEVEELNRQEGVVLIPGEELTCRSSVGRNLHMLVLGNREFLPGSGDGGQKWFRTRSELSVGEALERLDEGSFAAAAHPFVKTPFLEWFLVDRGNWTIEDLAESKLDGWQILNGRHGLDFEHGLSIWKNSIADGRRISIFGGNDAHGNFNRFRQVSLPMLKMKEHDDHVFGRHTTRVRVEGDLNPESILSALKSGRAIVSEGPIVDITANGKSGEVGIGDTVEINEINDCKLNFVSSAEFGEVVDIQVINNIRGVETPIYKASADDGKLPDPYRGEIPLSLPQNIGTGYLRAEIKTRTSDGESFRAWSNPIWLIRE